MPSVVDSLSSNCTVFKKFIVSHFPRLYPWLFSCFISPSQMSMLYYPHRIVYVSPFLSSMTHYYAPLNILIISLLTILFSDFCPLWSSQVFCKWCFWGWVWDLGLLVGWFLLLLLDIFFFFDRENMLVLPLGFWIAFLHFPFCLLFLLFAFLTLLLLWYFSQSCLSCAKTLTPTFRILLSDVCRYPLFL